MTTTYLYGANVQANGIRQHYLRYGGQGQPLVLVPGITSPAITWGFVAERLGRQFDVHVMDVRGRGLSESGDTLDYGIDACADDITALAAALGLDCYLMVGHSMGARFAIRAAVRNPHGLDKLVLIDPPVSGPDRRPYPSRLPWYVDSLRDCRQGADLETMRQYCPTWTDGQLRLRAEWLHTCNEKAVIDSFDGFQRDDIHADLPKIAVPTLLIAAGKGDVILPEDEQEIRELLPSIQTARVASAGHMIPWDDFEGFFAAFGTFLGPRL
ncbi:MULTISPECIES: alpha/beta fold hydrolase [Pseudomonas]|uniref:Alpha/beta hydrolase n=1 Tax=Pseudomonas luteola TaxID=47886 RepID=A0ABS0FSC0_PSELU|nr:MULTISPECIES: alpha/beta hydrolase [Pseudomonas]MBF8643219.1 alpha/beta hydrolase [Pseudomonas zeshuii]